MTLISVLDLDNCISDDQWRIDKIKAFGKNKYEEYHAASISDEFVWGIEDPFPERYVIFTARPEKWLDYTFEWAKEKLPVQPLDIYMRPASDYRPGVEVKEDMLRNFLFMIRGAYKIDKLYDDRENIVRMYKLLGCNGILKQINKR